VPGKNLDIFMPVEELWRDFRPESNLPKVWIPRLRPITRHWAAYCMQGTGTSSRKIG